jgi:hypothetical protein
VKPEQQELLRDKIEVWRRQAETGPLDYRDYNRRCADALASALLRIREQEGHIRTLELQQKTDRETIAALQEHGPAQGLGEGCRPVPIEPTEAMLAAGWRRANEIAPNALGIITDTACAEIWRVMYDAAPANPATPEPSGAGRLGRNETSSAGEGEKLREALERFVPFTITETADYAEVFDRLGEKLALTTRPEIFEALNAALASPDQAAVVPGGEGER